MNRDNDIQLIERALNLAVGSIAMGHMDEELDAPVYTRASEALDRMKRCTKALKWIINNPGAHPANVQAVAKEAFEG